MIEALKRFRAEHPVWFWVLVGLTIEYVGLWLIALVLIDEI